MRPGENENDNATACGHVIPAWNLCLRSRWHRAHHISRQAAQVPSGIHCGAARMAAGEQKEIAGSGRQGFGSYYDPWKTLRALPLPGQQ